METSTQRNNWALSIWSKIPNIPVRGVNGKFHNYKISGKSENAQKVVPFSRLERPVWFLVFKFQYSGNLQLNQFQAHGN